MSGTVDLFGRSFRLHPDGISEYALLEFAEAQRNVAEDDANSPAGMAALLSLVLDTLHEEDVPAFRAAARKHRAKADDLMKVISAATEETADRPTSEPSDSSAGLASIEQKSESLYERAERLRPGRLSDQMVLVRKWQEEGVASA